MRLIDADALMAKLEERKDPFVSIGYLSGLCKAQEYIDDAPTVEPEQPKIGHWIMTHDYFTGAYESIDYVKCSCCGEDSLEMGDYCPNCGAKMIEPQESEE